MHPRGRGKPDNREAANSRPPDVPLGQAGATTAQEWFPKHRATRHVATKQPQRESAHNVRRKTEREVPNL